MIVEDANEAYINKQLASIEQAIKGGDINAANKMLDNIVSNLKRIKSTYDTLVELRKKVSDMIKQIHAAKTQKQTPAVSVGKGYTPTGFKELLSADIIKSIASMITEDPDLFSEDHGELISLLYERFGIKSGDKIDKDLMNEIIKFWKANGGDISEIPIKGDKTVGFVVK